MSTEQNASVNAHNIAAAPSNQRSAADDDRRRHGAAATAVEVSFVRPSDLLRPKAAPRHDSPIDRDERAGLVSSPAHTRCGTCSIKTGLIQDLLESDSRFPEVTQLLRSAATEFPTHPARCWPHSAREPQHPCSVWHRIRATVGLIYFDVRRPSHGQRLPQRGPLLQFARR